MIYNSWNHKFLDYEIETEEKTTETGESPESWNHKFLDYEIETGKFGFMPFFTMSWNHKFLDYEIETPIICIV